MSNNKGIQSAIYSLFIYLNYRLKRITWGSCKPFTVNQLCIPKTDAFQRDGRDVHRM